MSQSTISYSREKKTRYWKNADQIRRGVQTYQSREKDPVLYPNFTSQYTSDDVADNSLIVVAGEKSKVISYSDLYETEMDYTTYQTNTTGFDGKDRLTVRFLMSRPRICR